MRRPSLWICGLALSVLCGTAAPVCAQEGPPLPRLFSDIPAAPKVDKAAETPLVEESKTPEPKLDVNVSPNTGLPRIESSDEKKFAPLSELALQSSDYIDPRYVANSQYPDEPGIWERTRTGYGDLIHRSLTDAKNFYLSKNLLYVGIAVGVAAPFANTHADIGIRNWYQRRVGNGQSRGLDETARVFQQFGEYKYAIPLYFAMSFSEHLFPDSTLIGTTSEFGNLSLRALAVGAPMVGILQCGLGADRPPVGESRWQPFRSSHTASGHAFVGAIPFLTAASMTDARVLQALLVTGSFGPGWSRIQTDRHYFSQVFLGWSMAYLSVQAVNQTDDPDRSWRIIPVDFPNGFGMGVLFQY